MKVVGLLESMMITFSSEQSLVPNPNKLYVEVEVTLFHKSKTSHHLDCKLQC